MVTNYRGIDAPRSAERGVLMTSPLPAGNVQVASGGRSFRSRCVYICNLNGPDVPYSRSMDDSKFENINSDFVLRKT